MFPFVGKKGAKEPWIIVSNFKFENPLGIYKRRWGIETLFGCLKSRGYRMEDTHITDGDRIERLLFVLAIAFCWVYKTGELENKDGGFFENVSKTRRNWTPTMTGRASRVRMESTVSPKYSYVS